MLKQRCSPYLRLINVLPPRQWVGKVRARVSSLSFEGTDWVKGNANNQLSITRPSLLPWRSLPVVGSSGFNLVEPWRGQVGETFIAILSVCTNHSWGALTLICFQPVHHFPSVWCQDKMTNLSAINCQFFFCMFIYLWQLPDDFFLIWMDRHHTAVIFGFAATGCTPFPPPTCQRIRTTPSPDTQIALSDIMIFIPSFNLLNMLRLVPDSLLL